MFRRAVPAALTAVVLALSLLTTTSASADSVRPVATGAVADITFPAGVSRLAGSDRYDTAIAVSKKYAPGTDAVFVATGANFPDALSAAAAAARLGAPLLLTPGSALPTAVRAEIARLNPSTIFIAGSEGAVGSAVERALGAIAPVERLGGSSRYETGNALVRRVFPQAAHAFIATGRTFPDALAATGAAGAISAPVILVDGTRNSLPAETRDLLAALGVSAVTIVGGTGAVSGGIESELANTHDVRRLGGAGRFDTAALINDSFFAPGSASAAFLATGQNFPDALAGAALAGRTKSPVYVTNAGCVPESAHLSLQRLGAPSTVALGGVAVVGAQAAANMGCLTTGVPSISGTARVTGSLTANVGTWTAGTSFQYQWLANGSPLPGATGARLPLTAAHAGRQISVRVTGSQPGYVAASVLSSRTAAVTYPASTTPIDSWNCPSWAPIKGNVGAKEKIYHLPGGRFYAATNPEECFRTEAAAQSAGYRRSKL
ncbi:MULTISPECIES: cell wall-binding repeat-containing protein [Microbacterium]|uniref:cell wall-binding repeat-containing protein n=1 Tax=Microbacterium TaxID=33882 RepID=UPI0011EAB215|nr:MULTISPECIES: cell wall-binding repeat-containing protein [Microbacterium]